MDFLSSTAFRPLELLINRGIGLSSTARAMAVALEGETLDVLLNDTPLRLRLHALDGRVRVGAASIDPRAAATLSGSPLAMLRLLGGDPQELIRAGDVQMTGNTDVANQFRDLLHMARPDLEEELSKLIGDPVAHQLGNFARGIVDWGARTAESVSRSFGEYLTEERRTLPTRPEVEEFYREVDQTANDVERAEARLSRLKDHRKDQLS